MRRRPWLPALVAAVVIAVASVSFAWPRLFGHRQHTTAASIDTSRPDYNVYRGHRWYLELPGSTDGFIDLGAGGAFTLWNTQQQLLGTYTIKASGQFIFKVTGVSSGKVFFDQAVVDAMDPIGNAPAFIRSTTPTALVLEVSGHTLTFAQH